MYSDLMFCADCGSKLQRVVIYYKFVGYLDIPDSNESRFVEDIRQGVAVEYVSDVPDWAERPFSRESKKEYVGRVMEQHSTG